MRFGRDFVGFEQNKNAYDAFRPTLDTVESKDDPVPEFPDPVELAKREKMREGWKSDRKRKKNKETYGLDPGMFSVK